MGNTNLMCSCEPDAPISGFGEAEDTLLSAAEDGDENKLLACIKNMQPNLNAKEPEVSFI